MHPRFTMNEHVKHAEDFCIAIAAEAKVRIARDALAQLSFFANFQPIVSDIGLPSNWARNSGGLGLFIGGLIVLPFFFLVCLMVLPFGFLQHVREIRKQRLNLSEKIAMARQAAEHPERPLEKTLRTLWAHHGLHEKRHLFAESIHVLEQWIGTLYGDDVAQRVAIGDRFTRIRQTRAEAHRRLRGSLIVKYAPVLRVIIDDLTAELPPYDQAVPASSEVKM